MFPGPVNSGLSLTKVLGGISKTLNMANQLIPIYVQAKPILVNARKTFTVAKEILKTPNTPKTNINKNEPSPIKKEKTLNVLPNRPVFFL